jgi:integrase
MTLAELIELFLAYVRHNRKASTAAHYRSRLRQVASRIGSRNLVEITPAEATATFAALNSGLSPDTVRANLVIWRVLMDWSVENGLLSEPILVNLKVPAGRLRRSMPTREQMTALAKVSSPDFRLIFRALRLTGARPNELVRARIEDIDQNASCLRLADHKTAGATGEPRLIAIGSKTMQELLMTAMGDRGSGPIFLQRNGRPWTVGRLGTKFREARSRAKLPTTLVMYLARHQAGQELWKATKDIKSVADFLGHKNIATTMRYTRVDAEALNAAQNLLEDRQG